MRAGAVALFALILLTLVGCGSQNKIVGKWKGSLSAATISPSDSDSERDKVDKALAVAMARQITLETEYRPDGTCSLALGDEKKNGTWTMQGNQLTHQFDGKPGEPVTVTWDGPDKFTMSGDDAPLMTYVREK